MASVFEVGNFYYNADGSFYPIEVLKRTAKTVWVRNSSSKWKMRINHYDNGEEFVVDSLSPVRWRWLYTYDSSSEEKDEKSNSYWRNQYNDIWKRRA